MIGIAKRHTPSMLFQVLANVSLNEDSGLMKCTTCQHEVKTEPNRKRNWDVTLRQQQCLDAFSLLHRHPKPKSVVARVEAAILRPFVVEDRTPGM
jgi:hypothetical protein